MKQNIPPGTKVKIPGTNIDAEIRPEEELTGDDMCRIACPKKDHDECIASGGPEVAGTRGGYFCRVCNCELVLAPSGQRIAAMGGDFTCVYCALRMLNEQKS